MIHVLRWIAIIGGCWFLYWLTIPYYDPPRRPTPHFDIEVDYGTYEPK